MYLSVKNLNNLFSLLIYLFISRLLYNIKSFVDDYIFINILYKTIKTVIIFDVILAAEVYIDCRLLNSNENMNREI